MDKIDVLVIGGGHAGYEAARASAAMGVRTVLMTPLLDDIAAISCHAGFGGPGRGQLIREIDALGGLMGEAIERSVLFKRMSNSGKGPAVRAPWALTDKHAYSQHVKQKLESLDNLRLFQDTVLSIKHSERGYEIATFSGAPVYADQVIVCCGTFLNANTHIGNEVAAGGRMGEMSSSSLSTALGEMGFRTATHSTGSPPVVDPGPLVDLSESELEKLNVQMEIPQDNVVFSYNYYGANKPIKLLKLHTNVKTHELALASSVSEDATEVSPQATSTRHCPSFRSKLIHSPNTDGFTVFLEPITADHPIGYLQGLSLDASAKEQEAIVRSISGLENASIVRPGYSVRYEVVLPDQLNNFLEARDYPGFFMAGQAIASSGYAEAGAQGLIAGINAARRALNQNPFELARDKAFIGVLVKDLTSGTQSEPTRMLTARVENRTDLRCDNSDERLAGVGYKLGIVSKERLELAELLETRRKGLTEQEISETKRKIDAREYKDMLQLCIDQDLVFEAEAEKVYEPLKRRDQNRLNNMRNTADK